MFQHRIHQQTDPDNSEAGNSHQCDAGHHGRPIGVAVDERLDQRRAEHRGDHLNDEQDPDGPGHSVPDCAAAVLEIGVLVVLIA